MRWRWRGRDRARTAAVVHPTFRDPQRQAAFDRDGYIVMDLLDAEEVARLAEGVGQVMSRDVAGLGDLAQRQIAAEIAVDHPERPTRQRHAQAVATISAGRNRDQMRRIHRG